MLFSSPLFVFLFLPVVLLGYFLVGKKLQNLFLVLSSIFFYTWGEPRFIIFLLFAILLNYLSGLFINRSIQRGNKEKARFILFLTIIFNLSLLIYYKYRLFILNNILLLKPSHIPSVVSNFFDGYNFYIPLALSFFAFHAISYNIDIFRNESKAQKNPLKLLLYFLFFPHLLSGPIIRYHQIADQLKKRLFNLEDFTYGINRFITGLAKKVLIADRLAPVVNEIFAIPSQHLNTDTAWLGIICFSFQIYFDFSAYSDMAIGLARMFGFKFPENFNYPYISLSIREFWRRWHITLSNWFRDYLYIPLGGNRVFPLRNYLNLCIVFLLVGLWHGASWNFVIWGGIHATFLVLERTKIGKIIDSLWKPLRHLYVLLVVTLSWVFFRIDNLQDSLNFLKVLFGLRDKTQVIYRPINYFLSHEVIFILLVAFILSMSFYPSLRNLFNDYIKSKKYNFTQNLIFGSVIKLFLIAILFLSFIFMASQTYRPFLYFRF